MTACARFSSSFCVDGKPRQKHIAVLGSIALDSLGAPEPRFWCEVTSKLKRLGDRIGPEDYERIIASIAAKVGGQLFSSLDVVAGIAAAVMALGLSPWLLLRLVGCTEAFVGIRRASETLIPNRLVWAIISGERTKLQVAHVKLSVCPGTI